jgi:hypothetical protein
MLSVYLLGIISMVVNSQDDNTVRRLILNIANLSEKYHQEYLARWSKDKLLNDWYYAFNFFLDHTLLQGRSDRVSEKVVEVVFKVSEHNRNMIEEGFKSGSWKDLMGKLIERIGKGKVGKRADVNHVIDSLEFLREKFLTGTWLSIQSKRSKREEYSKYMGSLME